MLRAPLALLVLFLFAPAAQAETRYASVGGSGTDCTQAAPCDLQTAITAAGSGDEVVVGAGTYSGAVSNQTLAVPDGVAVRGATIGTGRPVLPVGLDLGDGTSVQDLELTRSGSEPSLLLQDGATADRMLVRQTDAASDEDACAVGPSSSIRNSLCVEASAGGAALSFIDSTASVRNVTAIGAGFGLYTDVGGTAEALIAKGGAEADVEHGGTTGAFRDVLYVSLAGSAPTTNDGHIGTAAVFRAVGDYRQGTGSPTLQAGDLEDSTTSATDLDLNGNLRKIGDHVDVGAYEQPPAPVVTAGTNTVTTADGATLAGTVNPGGGRGEAHFIYGPDTSYGSQTSPQPFDATTSSFAVTAPITGQGDAPTHYKLVVTTDGGTTSSDDKVAYRAPTLTPSDATAITQTTATLNATVALKGAPEGKVEFVYGAATSAPQTITGDGPVKVDLTGLSPRTTYQWKLRVTREGEFFETPIGTFTTAGPPAQATPTPEPSASPSPSPSASPGPSFSAGSSPAASRRAGKKLLRVGRLSVTGRCGDLPCAIRASGTVSIGKKRYGILAAPKKPLKLDADEAGQITLTANKRLRRRVRRYLKRHKKAKAIIRVRGVLTDADGSTVKKLTIRTR